MPLTLPFLARALYGQTTSLHSTLLIGLTCALRDGGAASQRQAEAGRLIADLCIANRQSETPGQARPAVPAHRRERGTGGARYRAVCTARAAPALQRLDQRACSSLRRESGRLLPRDPGLSAGATRRADGSNPKPPRRIDPSNRSIESERAAAI